MKTTQVGLLLGAILGIVLVFRSFGDMLIVALVAAIGWAVAAAISGELDLGEIFDRSSDRGSDRQR